jgi:hypothetical protein
MPVHLWVPVRICAAVREEFGHEALGRFLGRFCAELWHPDSRGLVARSRIAMCWHGNR